METSKDILLKKDISFELKEIGIEVIQLQIKHLTQRTRPSAENIFTLLLKLENSPSIHSDILSPLKRLRKKQELLIPKSNSYTPGVKSKEYKMTDFLKDIKEKVLIKYKETFFDYIPNNRIRDYLQDNYFLFDCSHQDELEIKEWLLIVGKTKVNNKEFFIIPLKSKRKEIYHLYIGREYNTFNLMRSKLRKYTNYPNQIDLSSSVQSVMISQYQMIKGLDYDKTLDMFPRHKEYVQNKDYQRERISKKYSISIEETKEILTALTFGGGLKKRYQDDEFLKEYKQEISIMSKEILTLINRLIKYNPKPAIAKYIQEQSKKKKIEKEQKIMSFRTKLFFWYEYQERKIINALTEDLNFNDYILVHDAIYTESNIELNLDELKEKVKRDTDFTIYL